MKTLNKMAKAKTDSSLTPVIPLIGQKKNEEKELLKHNYSRNRKRILCTILTILCTISMILTAGGILAFSLLDKRAIYGSRCTYGLCISTLGFECIDNRCQCNADSYFMKRCQLKIDYGKTCHNISSPCNENANLKCIDGKCNCDDFHYWNGQNCQLKQAYDGPCQNSNIQCFTNSLLYCDIIEQKCQCRPDR